MKRLAGRACCDAQDRSSFVVGLVDFGFGGPRHVIDPTWHCTPSGGRSCRSRYVRGRAVHDADVGRNEGHGLFSSWRGGGRAERPPFVEVADEIWASGRKIFRKMPRNFFTLTKQTEKDSRKLKTVPSVDGRNHAS